MLPWASLQVHIRCGQGCVNKVLAGPGSFTGPSRGESISSLTHIVGRIQFLAAVGLTSLSMLAVS